MESSVYFNRKTKFYEYLRNTEYLSKLLHSNWRKPCNINNYLSHELVEMHLILASNPLTMQAAKYYKKPITYFPRHKNS